MENYIVWPHCTCWTEIFTPTCHAHLPHPPATPTSHTHQPHPPTKHISHRTNQSGSRVYQVGVKGRLHLPAMPNCHAQLPRPPATPTCHAHLPCPPATPTCNFHLPHPQKTYISHRTNQSGKVACVVGGCGWWVWQVGMAGECGRWAWQDGEASWFEGFCPASACG